MFAPVFDVPYMLFFSVASLGVFPSWGRYCGREPKAFWELAREIGKRCLTETCHAEYKFEYHDTFYIQDSMLYTSGDAGSYSANRSASTSARTTLKTVVEWRSITGTWRPRSWSETAINGRAEQKFGRSTSLDGWVYYMAVDASWIPIDNWVGVISKTKGGYDTAGAPLSFGLIEYVHNSLYSWPREQMLTPKYMLSLETSPCQK